MSVAWLEHTKGTNKAQSTCYETAEGQIYQTLVKQCIDAKCI